MLTMIFCLINSAQEAKFKYKDNGCQFLLEKFLLCTKFWEACLYQTPSLQNPLNKDKEIDFQLP